MGSVAVGVGVGVVVAAMEWFGKRLSGTSGRRRRRGKAKPSQAKPSACEARR